MGLTAAREAKVEADELDHVRLQEIHVPPRIPLPLREGTRLWVERVARASVHRFLSESQLCI